MGLRNPFRIEYNQETGELYIADYSPDANTADPLRGPAGQGKWSIVTEAANFGWPYCATAELPYVDYDFATGVSGEPFDCANPVNESPNNTGLTELPPVTQPDVWYTYTLSAEFPELETGGIGPMAGPAYQFDAKAAKGKNPTAWPEYYDGVPLFYEWTRDYIKAFFTEGGDVTRIEDVLASFDLQNPIDIEFGPNGSLYVLNYGNGFFGRNQPGAELVRIDYLGPRGNRSPTVNVTASQVEGSPPLTVQFTSTVADPEGRRIKYAWDFDGDGKIDSRQPNPDVHVHGGGRVPRHAAGDRPGRPDRVGLRRDHRRPAAGGGPDRDGRRQRVPVRRHRAVLGGGDRRPARRLQQGAGDLHPRPRHPRAPADHGLRVHRAFVTTVPTGHDPATDDLNAVFAASYTDPGSGSLPPLTGTDQVVIAPTQ